MGMTCLLPSGKPNNYKYHVEVYAWYPILQLDNARNLGII